MSRWWQKAADLAAEGQNSVLITICSVAGSAPREAGTKMLVWQGGQLGTVGGGNLEFTVADQARKLLTSGATHRFQSYPLGPLLGQCCGGRVGMLLERVDKRSREWLAQVGAAEDVGRPYAIHSTLSARGIVRRVVDLGGATAISGDIAQVTLIGPDGGPVGPATQFQAQDFSILERAYPRPLLIMFGAGHVGRALAPIVATLPFRLAWFDNRLEYSTCGATLADDLVAKAEAAPPDGLFLVFTQSHSFDYELTRAILKRGDFRYCGLIGSRTKRARFEKRLLADGVPRAMLARLVCPIGSIGLASKAPEVLAIGVAAELLSAVQSHAAARAFKAVHGH